MEVAVWRNTSRMFKVSDLPYVGPDCCERVSHDAPLIAEGGALGMVRRVHRSGEFGWREYFLGFGGFRWATESRFFAQRFLVRVRNAHACRWRKDSCWRSRLWRTVCRMR